MTRKIELLYGSMLTLSLFLLACVTINIYFPAEKVKSAAGEIVDDIRNRKPHEKHSGTEQQRFYAMQRIKRALSPSVACAQDVTGVSNPTIRALKERMKARYAQMKSFYDRGLLKEGNNGYVSIAGSGGLSLKEKRDLNNLVSAENSDRKTLYAEVAKALNIDPSQVNRVAEIFAKEWQK
jgi:uncharacterized protein YdbL (DUF1318 family)